MKKGFYLLLAVVALACLCLGAIGYKLFLISNDSRGSSVAAAVESADISADDLAQAALYFKNTSEQGTSDDYELEYKFASAAAELGNTDAMLFLGEMYQGNKISQASEGDNVLTAIDWWKKAGENGLGRGYTNIGLLYMHQSVPGGGDDFGDIEYDSKTAISYYEKGAELNDFKAYRYIGLAYQDGTGVVQSDEEAYTNFAKAAELGDSTGQLYQADYLLVGKGTGQDVDQAVSLYQDLIDNDAHDKGIAAYKLGLIYQEGIYVTADTEKAKNYYQIALETANEENNTDLAGQTSQALASLE